MPMAFRFSKADQAAPRPTMKRILLALLAILMFQGLLPLVPASGAQDQAGAVISRSRPRRAQTLDVQVKKLTDELKLDSTQQARVKAILLNREIRLREVFKNDSLSAVDRFAAVKTIQERSNEQITRILTAEQGATFDQLRHGAPPQSSPKAEQ